MHFVHNLSLATVLLLLGVTGCSTPSSTGHQPVAAGHSIPAPQALQERAYLGLPESSTEFSLDQVAGEILIIDCFDMYCHACQRDADLVDALYELVQERGLGERIRFVGLGVGNTPLETSLFQRKFSIPGNPE